MIIKCYCGTSGLYWDIPLMKVSVGRDSENSLLIVIVLLKSGLLATMIDVMLSVMDMSLIIFIVIS